MTEPPRATSPSAASTRRYLFGLGSMVAIVALGVTTAPGCIFAFSQNSLGQGSGCVTGILNVPACWQGNFNLSPDFFVAVPYETSLDIRVQRGSDFETFSDGLAVLVDNVDAIRPGNDAGIEGGGLYDQLLSVSIPAGVSAPGVPLMANPNPSIVHAVLYLQSSCQTQNVSLYALESVSLSPDGSCNGVAANASSFLCGNVFPDGDVDTGVPDVAAPDSTLPVEAGGRSDGGGASDAGRADAALPVEAGAPDAGPPSPPIGHSTIVFHDLFDANPDESNAQQRLTQATFDLYLADPRTVSPGGIGPPPMCQAHIQGNFRFFFQRGQPAQPFP